MKLLKNICFLAMGLTQLALATTYQRNLNDLSHPGTCTPSQKACTFHNLTVCCDTVAYCGSNGVGPTCVFQHEADIESFSNRCLGAKVARGCPNAMRCGITPDLTPSCVSQRCGDEAYACSGKDDAVCCKKGEECVGAKGKVRCVASTKRCSSEERLCYGNSGENCCPKDDDCTSDGMCLTASIPSCPQRKQLCPSNANLGANYDSPSEPFLCCRANEYCEDLQSAGSYACSRTPQNRGIKGIAHSLGKPETIEKGEFH
jgi:hypothetical protein